MWRDCLLSTGPWTPPFPQEVFTHTLAPQQLCTITLFQGHSVHWKHRLYCTRSHTLTHWWQWHFNIIYTFLFRYLYSAEENLKEPYKGFMSDFEIVTLWYIFLFITHNSHLCTVRFGSYQENTNIFTAFKSKVHFVTVCHQAKINTEKSYHVFLSAVKDFLNVFCRNDRVWLSKDRTAEMWSKFPLCAKLQCLMWDNTMCDFVHCSTKYRLYAVHFM